MFRGLAARKYFTARDVVRFAISQMRFRLLATEHRGDMSQAKAAALAFVKGWPVADLHKLSEEIFDELIAERIWSGTRALAQLHLDAGQRVWLVTAAPIELGRVMADRLRLTGALGTVAEIEHGVYTGRLVGDLLHGPAKAEAIVALAKAEGLDLGKCTAYSDSANDIPMLSLVGHAVAVNPDAALRREARQRGWEIRDFRTGRKAVKIAVPAALGTGIVIGAAAATAAIRRRQRG
jgi:HAD superfamily hydrolase (TIGR01490 family)